MLWMYWNLNLFSFLLRGIVAQTSVWIGPLRYRVCLESYLGDQIRLGYIWGHHDCVFQQVSFIDLFTQSLFVHVLQQLIKDSFHTCAPEVDLKKFNSCGTKTSPLPEELHILWLIVCHFATWGIGWQKTENKQTFKTVCFHEIWVSSENAIMRCDNAEIKLWPWD